MILEAASGDPFVREILERHPRVASVAPADHPGIDFRIGEWHRTVIAAQPEGDVFGLTELMDNNPMVCADRVGVPGPVETLTLIGLGPVAWAGLIVEPPSIIASVPASAESVGLWLGTAGWQGGASVHVEPQDLGSVVAITAMAAIRTPEDWSDIDALYEERFGRSFFVRRDEDAEWSPELVMGRPFAAYRLRVTPDDPHSLLTALVLADRNGKCGAGQIVHAMNVMAGYEESLGIA